MELIQRYLFALSNHLAKQNKEDIIKEVESNIYDMLGEDFSNENVENVLKQLGNPRTLSMEYQTKKRYIIGPEYFNDYIKTILYVTVLVGSIFFILSIVKELSSGYEGKSILIFLAGVFGKGIAGFLSGVVSSAIWVTVIFVAFENSGYIFDGKRCIKKEDWNPKMLQPIIIKKKTKEYKKTSLFADMFFSILFTICFIFLAKYIGIYYQDGIFIQTFNMNRFSFYAGYFIMMIIYIVFMNLTMMHVKYPNYKTAIIKAIYNILSTVIGFLFIFDNQLFQENFKIELMNLLQINGEKFNMLWNGITIFIAVVLVIGLLADTIREFYRSYQNANS